MEQAIRDMRRDMSASTRAMTTMAVAFAVGISLVFALLSSILVPGGVVTRMSGLAIVTGNNVEIDRARSLVRALIAWSPAIAWIAWLSVGPGQIWTRDPRAPIEAILALTLLSAGAGVALFNVSRGVHDRIVGTWVVPR